MHRFFVPDLAPDRAVARLPRDEAEHLARVLRLKAGDLVRVFDGRGQEFVARIESADRDAVTVRPLEPAPPAPEPSVDLTLAQAALKADKMDQVVRDAVMLGTAAIQPVVSARAEISAAALSRARRVERWHRVAVASVKQCGRAVVPSVRPALALETYLAQETAAVRMMLVEPGRRAGASGHARGAGIESLATRRRPASAALLVGPEGGWTAGEIDRAIAAGFRPLTLGGRTLRAEAAPIVAITVLQTIWGDL